MRTDISNSNDVIDSRQVIERIEELEAERDELADAADDTNAEATDADRAALREWDESDEAKELADLKALADEAEDYSEDWHHGATLIRDSYFTEYAEQLVSDIGDLPNDVPGYLVIDWEKTADNIRIDYTAVEFGDVTYWVR